MALGRHRLVIPDGGLTDPLLPVPQGVRLVPITEGVHHQPVSTDERGLLEFDWDESFEMGKDQTRRVSIAGCLDMFVGLADGDPEGVREFASRFGPLGLGPDLNFPRRPAHPSIWEMHLVEDRDATCRMAGTRLVANREAVSAWCEAACEARAILTLTAQILGYDPTDRAQWDFIRCAHPQGDLLDAVRPAKERRRREKALIAQALNGWHLYGQLDYSVEWPGDADRPRQPLELVDVGGVLAWQLITAVTSDCYGKPYDKIFP